MECFVANSKVKMSDQSLKNIEDIQINDYVIDAFGNIVDMMIEVSSMKDAVTMSQRLAEKGDSVLLSPACASFDLFENYEDRGNQFKNAVQHL